MSTRMQQRRGTASQWLSTNSGNGPILAAGEIGFESDTNKFKIGDGINHWIDLVYFTDAESALAGISDLIAGAPAALDTLNELAAAINDDPNFFSTIATNLSNHESDTTNIHGITDTAELATKTFAANLLVNATKSNITITGDKNGLTISAENGVADSTTDNLTEGTINRYFTDERAQDAVGNSVGTGLTYTDSTGEIKVTPNTYDAYGAASTVASDAATALSNHESDTTNIHGIADTSKLVTTDGTQTLTNKTITSPSGLVKADVGLGNVDNTSDANKPVSSATQTALDLKANLAGAAFSGVVSTTDATQSTSTSTGSIKTSGGLGVAKNAYIGGNLTISGDFTVSGTTTTVNTTNLNVTDPMIYMGGDNSANLVDLGIVSSFNDGTYQHTGLVRDASDGKWKLFKGVTDEPTTTVNFTQGSLDDIAVGALTATSIAVGNVSNTEFGYLDGVTSAIQTQLDAKLASSTASSTYAPIANPTFTGTVSGITKSMVGLGNVENTALSTWAGTSNITTLGTIATGTWSASTIALNKGGTGATTQAGAANAILPTQTSNSGKYLTTNGTDVSWATVSSYSAPTIGSTSIASGATVTSLAGLTKITANAYVRLDASSREVDIDFMNIMGAY